MSEANELADRIAARLGQGDAASDLIGQLAERVGAIGRLAAGAGGNLPDALREEVARLLARVQAAATSGEEWVARTRDERASRDRLRRAYGLTPRSP